ncbi:MAG: hypothetical protein QE271_06390 [Bacteriovoracaceae bacterium]|nr:hypothetical protein [Bacteriovoracaceae bacterium]
MKTTTFILSFIIVSILQLQLHTLFGHEKSENGDEQNPRSITFSHSTCSSCHYLAISNVTLHSPPQIYSTFVHSFSYKILNQVILSLDSSSVLVSQFARAPPFPA